MEDARAGPRICVLGGKVCRNGGRKGGWHCLGDLILPSLRATLWQQLEETKELEEEQIKLLCH